MTTNIPNSDLFYTDNPVYITFNGILPNTKYIEYFPFTNNPNAQISPNRIYTNGRTSITIDVSSIAKIAMPNVPHNTNYTYLNPIIVQNNIVNIDFIIKEVSNTGIEVSRPTITLTFIKGGNATYNANQSAQINVPLTPIDIIPQWGGLPVDYYYINASKQMVKSNVIPDDKKEIRKIKGCDPLYIKFRNSKGGYSYWLFENWEKETQSKNYGIVEQRTSVYDLGNESELKITAISKVPKRFFPLIEDLVNSGEIYRLLSNNQWERIISDNNKVNQNLFNQNEKVKLKFNVPIRYKPAAIW
jgi:hypothetical protein